jgi:beta-barrel assembly-enhancing protease
MNQNYKEFESILKDWNSTTVGRKSFLASLPILFAACAMSDKSRYREGDNAGQDTSLTVQDEVKLTESVKPQMQKDYPAIQNADLQNYISTLGNDLVRANNLQGNPYNYNFTVVGVNYVNAFALPAGTVYITAPLIAMADTEAELLGVVGHEVGHIQARHTAERMDAAKKAESSTWKYAVGGGAVGGIAGFGLGKLLCPPNDNGCLAKATAAGAAVGAGGGYLVQKYTFMANSRENEMEADRIGFKRSVAANYSKAHVGKFYEKLLQMEKENKKGGNAVLASLTDAMSTHPPSQERVNQMNKMVEEAPGNSSAKISSNAFDQMKKFCMEWSRQNQKS